jgi:hypothetical protein
LFFHSGMVGSTWKRVCFGNLLSLQMLVLQQLLGAANALRKQMVVINVPLRSGNLG